MSKITFSDDSVEGDLGEASATKYAEIYFNHIVQKKKLDIEIEKIKLERKLSPNSIAISIGAIVFSVILFVSVYEWSRGNDNRANEIENKDRQLKLEREKFEYQKSEQNKTSIIKSNHG